MKELSFDKMEQVEGGFNLACFAAGLGAVALISEPELIIAAGDEEETALVACAATL